MQAGEIPVVTIGKVVRVREEDIDSFEMNTKHNPDIADQPKRLSLLSKLIN